MKKAIVGAAGSLAFLALVLANMQTLIDFWKRNFGEETTIKPLKGAIAMIIPTQERSPLRSNTGTANRLPVQIESLQHPGEAPMDYEFYFDVYLRNLSDRDLLLTSLDYKSAVEIPRGDTMPDAGAVVPNVMYNLTYKMGHRGSVALSPPYRLGPHALGAVRIKLVPDHEVEMIHAFEAWLVDSEGRSTKVFRTDRSCLLRGPECAPPTPTTEQALEELCNDPKMKDFFDDC